MFLQNHQLLGPLSTLTYANNLKETDQGRLSQNLLGGGNNNYYTLMKWQNYYLPGPNRES